MSTRIVKILLALAMPLALHAKETNFAAGQASASWLKLGVDARSSGMGEAGRLTSMEADAVRYNPAGLAKLEGKQVGLMHSTLFEDMSLEHLSGAMNLGDGLGAGLSVDYLNYGEVPTYKVSGNDLQKGAVERPNAYVVSAGAGFAMSMIDLGASLKFFSDNLPGAALSGYGLDLGARWANDALSLGLAVKNLGATSSSASLPSTAELGAGWQQPIGPVGLNLAVDLGAPTVDTSALRIGAGAELTAMKNYHLRGGYRMVGNGGISGLTAGAGANWSILRLDYAFVDQGDLGKSHQVSLLTKF